MGDKALAHARGNPIIATMRSGTCRRPIGLAVRLDGEWVLVFGPDFVGDGN